VFHVKQPLLTSRHSKVNATQRALLARGPLALLHFLHTHSPAWPNHHFLCLSSRWTLSMTLSTLSLLGAPSSALALVQRLSLALRLSYAPAPPGPGRLPSPAPPAPGLSRRTLSPQAPGRLLSDAPLQPQRLSLAGAAPLLQQTLLPSPPQPLRPAAPLAPRLQVLMTSSWLSFAAALLSLALFPAWPSLSVLWLQIYTLLSIYMLFHPPLTERSTLHGVNFQVDTQKCMQCSGRPCPAVPPWPSRPKRPFAAAPLSSS
jgi:hypothetical protein